jgi:hypothetical protein
MRAQKTRLLVAGTSPHAEAEEELKITVSSVLDHEVVAIDICAKSEVEMNRSLKALSKPVRSRQPRISSTSTLPVRTARGHAAFAC